MGPSIILHSEGPVVKQQNTAVTELYCKTIDKTPWICFRYASYYFVGTVAVLFWDNVTTLYDIWFHIVYQHASILDCYTIHQGCLHTQICLPSHSLICDIHIVSQKVFLVTDCIWVRSELYINMPVRCSTHITLGSIFTLFANVTSREQTYFLKKQIVNNYFWHIQVIWEWDWYLEHRGCLVALYCHNTKCGMFRAGDAAVELLLNLLHAYRSSVMHVCGKMPIRSCECLS